MVQSAGAAEYIDWISVEGQSSPNECPGYDTKQSDSEAPVMLELWGMQSAPSFPLNPGRHWAIVVAPDRVLPMGPIEPCSVLMLNWIV